MSDSPVDSEQLEPTEEHSDDDEPARKRSRISENLIEENRQLKEDNENLHRIILQISDSVAQLNEKFLKLENENLAIKEEQKLRVDALASVFQRKIDALQLETLEKFLAHEKSIQAFKMCTDRKNYKLESRISNMETEIEENLEIRITSIEKEYNETMECAEEKQEKWNTGIGEKLVVVEKNSKIGQKSLETEIDNLKKNYGSDMEKIEGRILRMEDTHRSKLTAYGQAIQQCKEYLGKMKSAGSGENQKKKQEQKSILQRVVLPPRHHTAAAPDDQNLPKTAGELQFQSKCIFCLAKNHRSMDCENVPEYLDRIHSLNVQNRCTKCLELLNSKKHKQRCLRSRVVCLNCQWDIENAEEADFHHPIVCRLNDKSPYCEARRQSENERRLSHGLPPRFVI